MIDISIKALIIACGDYLFLFAAIVTCLSSIGIIRLPNFYTRIHATGISDSWAIIIAIIGLMMKSYNVIICLKLSLIILLIIIITPTTTHCLIRSGYTMGHKND